ncbi:MULTISPECIES: Imm45 family immunity protein [unclassified Rhizobium]|uniref:Imm45 family immunity protein n=1 Tax=unclassified Rhizobium TaxID=2613769 RepID=UPI0007133D79|nr:MULTISPECIES: Imm45 family immunity protein [unclassified Rhizobium]KQS89643.1 hypothetical protein ASG42_13225 [Rhizobium sp. Leaf391]KQS94923.1 hypothetical protein ASG50_27175 [Rhizobium sp. Leaf386]KQU01299.1 hypothetical protein ASG68_05955 [Rhizobium sp. Leaf453]
MAIPIEDMHHGQLDVGDVLRLPENYDLGPGSEPVDLLVYDPRDDEYGLGLMVVSGYKAGLIFSVFPRESRSLDNGLSVEWLLGNWDRWFRFTYVDQPVPVKGACVLTSGNYRLVDDEEPYDPNQALEDAQDRLISPPPDELRRLLSQPAGHFIDMAIVSPGIDLGRERILVTWLPYKEMEGCEVMTLYFDAKSWKTKSSFHSEHWIAISKEEPV